MCKKSACFGLVQATTVLLRSSRTTSLLLLLAISGASTLVMSPAYSEGISSSPPVSAHLLGYLSPAELPDSKAFLPPPLALHDATFQAADESAYLRGLTFRDTERGKLAARDANINKYPEALAAFACAMGFTPSEADTPNLLMLMRRVKIDAIQSSLNAKNAYNRIRPYVVHKANTCDISDEIRLSTQGSYPSGHASTGWAWALVLAELMPAQRNALLERGYSFGESRVICGYHWQSDIDAGRLVGAATVAALHANPDFKAQMEAARTELEINGVRLH